MRAAATELQDFSGWLESSHCKRRIEQKEKGILCFKENIFKLSFYFVKRTHWSR